LKKQNKYTWGDIFQDGRAVLIQTDKQKETFVKKRKGMMVRRWKRKRKDGMYEMKLR